MNRHRATAIAALATILVSAASFGTDAQSPLGPRVPSAPALAPTLADGAAIGGRVIDGATGTPLAGAMVTLTGVEGATGQARLPAGRQATDSSGRFLFRRLAATRTYHVTASKPGYFMGAHGMDGSRPLPRRIAPTEGQWVRDATIPMWRPSSITGTILDEAGDPVVGVPVAVVAEVLVAGVPQHAGGPVAYTDDRGLYRIAPLTPGVYTVVVPSLKLSVPSELPAIPPASTPNASRMLSSLVAGQPSLVEGQPTALPQSRLSPDLGVLPLDDGGFLIVGAGALRPSPRADGQRQTYPLMFYPAARSMNEAVSIQLGPGEERLGIDVQIHPVPARRVSGVVEGPADAIGNRRLRLVTPDSESLGAGHEVAAALTGPTGQFSFVDVPDGHYRILAGAAHGYTFNLLSPLLTPSLRDLVSLTGVSPLSAGTVSPIATIPAGQAFGADTSIRLAVDAGKSDSLAGRTEVDVAGADQNGVVVRLHGGVSVSGRFVIDTPQDRTALDIRSTRLEVIAEPADAQPSLTAARTAAPLTGSVLDFTLANLRPGDYVLRMLVDSGTAKSIVWGGKDYAGVPLTVTDRDISGVVITVTSQVAGAEGTVRHARGGTASYASVICFPTDPSRWRRYGPRPDRLRSVPVKSGSYQLPAVPAGDYFLVAVDEAFADRWKDPAFLEAASRMATRVTLVWGETRNQDLVLMDGIAEATRR